MKKIPPVDLARQYQVISEEASKTIIEILHSGRYIGGLAVTNFEQELANYLGVEQCVGCNSGTDALYMALRALNIGQGDEVITTPFTFIATAEVITRVGATPVFVDLEADSFNFALEQVSQAITPQTKAIIPVHLFGQPVDMQRLMQIAEAHNLYVIEDCAQATGAEWNGQKVGSIGHIGCFSFFPTKNLGACGDGGALTTNDKAIAERVTMLREHGLKVRYRHELTGINSRLDSIQAALLSIKLRYLDSWNLQRQQAAAYYHQLLQPIPELTLPQALLPSTSVWNQYTIQIKDNQTEGESRRDRVKQKLAEMGVIAMVYYPLPLHLQPVYHHLGDRSRQLPLVEQAAREVLSLPIFPGILEEEQEQVVHSLKDCL